MKMRKIVAISGTRADFGLLRPILKKISETDDLLLYLVVTGMHLSEEFGNTYKDIEKNGVSIYKKIYTLNQEDDGRGMAQFIGNTLTQSSNIFKEIDPDNLLLLGDRGEMLAGAIAAKCMNIKIIHIHGGENSGSVDDSFRNAISMLSDMFFVTTEQAKQNLLSMNIRESEIYIVGAPGLDEIKELIVPVEDIEKKYNVDSSEHLILVIQHPVVTEYKLAKNQMKITLDSILELNQNTLLVYPNADAGGRVMIDEIKHFAKKMKKLQIYKNLPREDYLSLLQIASVLIGNSSSGIIEAPSFNLPVINIGTRQNGRLRSGNIIDVPHDKDIIVKTISQIISERKENKVLDHSKNPWGDGDASSQIIKILRTIKSDE